MGTEFGLKLALEQIVILRQSIAQLEAENEALKEELRDLHYTAQMTEESDD